MAQKQEVPLGVDPVLETTRVSTAAEGTADVADTKGPKEESAPRVPGAFHSKFLFRSCWYGRIDEKIIMNLSIPVNYMPEMCTSAKLETVKKV